jgi:hypothetical protein
MALGLEPVGLHGRHYFSAAKESTGISDMHLRLAHRTLPTTHKSKRNLAPVFRRHSRLLSGERGTQAFVRGWSGPAYGENNHMSNFNRKGGHWMSVRFWSVLSRLKSRRCALF